MQPQFRPPSTEQEFKERADAADIKGTRAVLKARRQQRDTIVKPIDDEIAYLEKVLKYKGVEI